MQDKVDDSPEPSRPERSRPGRPRPAEIFSTLKAFVIGSAVAFVLLNLVVLPWAGDGPDPVTARYGDDVLATAYPDRDADEISTLLRETWTTRHVYRPFTQYVEGATDGTFVNVSEHGYRETGHTLAWPPATDKTNVFLFGGSTMFGYGVADNETLAAALQRQLGDDVAVYNFGQGAFYSTSERILFAELLLAGHAPDLALFFDGLNEFAIGEPIHTGRLIRLFEDRSSTLALRLLRRLPVLKLVSDRLARPPVESDAPVIDPAFDDDAISGRIDRYLGNVALIRALAEVHDVWTHFVVQPVPTHGYDLTHHPFAAWGFEVNSRSAFGYPRLLDALADLEPGVVTSLADLQQDSEQALYVDQVHYSPEMNEMIATALVAPVRAALEGGGESGAGLTADDGTGDDVVTGTE
ncbi:MAG: hypothetical protein AAGD38_19005 [Acidobacteriota bacterium]